MILDDSRWCGGRRWYFLQILFFDINFSSLDHEFGSLNSLQLTRPVPLFLGWFKIIQVLCTAQKSRSIVALREKGIGYVQIQAAHCIDFMNMCATINHTIAEILQPFLDKDDMSQWIYEKEYLFNAVEACPIVVHFGSRKIAGSSSGKIFADLTRTIVEFTVCEDVYQYKTQGKDVRREVPNVIIIMRNVLLI